MLLKREIATKIPVGLILQLEQEKPQESLKEKVLAVPAIWSDQLFLCKSPIRNTTERYPRKHRQAIQGTQGKNRRGKKTNKPKKPKRKIWKKSQLGGQSSVDLKTHWASFKIGLVSYSRPGTSHQFHNYRSDFLGRLQKWKCSFNTTSPLPHFPITSLSACQCRELLELLLALFPQNTKQHIPSEALFKLPFFSMSLHLWDNG